MTRQEMATRYWATFDSLLPMLDAVKNGKLTEAERSELYTRKRATKRALEFAERKLQRLVDFLNSEAK